MACRSSYLLRIEGRLQGDNSAIVNEMKRYFDQRPTPGGAASRAASPGTGWPDGLVLQGFEVCTWKFVAEQQGPETLISFRAEVHCEDEGTLYSNRRTAVPSVDWFYHSPEYQWHNELKKKLEDWNSRIGQSNLIERLRFRDWQWYCGNGGGD